MNDDSISLENDDAVAIHTGFPNPALDHLEQSSQTLALDMNQLLVKHPSSTYLFRIKGHNWASFGIHDGDIAIIDRALQPEATDYVIVWQASGFTICRFAQLDQQDHYWGVIAATIHPYH